MSLIDLTQPFTYAMPAYPGDPLTQIAFIAKDGFTDHLLRTSMHSGTHMEAPLHMIEGGAMLSAIPPERFMGRGMLIDARGNESVGIEALKNIVHNMTHC